MRITYYCFPNSMSVRERALAYKQIVEGRHDIKEIPADVSDERLEKNFPVEFDTTVTMAKKLMKIYGGHAWTNHIDRDGGVFEVSEVKLKGNNSRFKYSHHI